MPARGIQHIDLAVGEVERSLAFYSALLEPRLGLRPAGDGPYRHYGVGIEHLGFEVDRADEVDAAYERCVAAGGRIQSPPDRHYVEAGDDYYAFFAFDPDGIRVEVFAWPSSPYRTT